MANIFDSGSKRLMSDFCSLKIRIRNVLEFAFFDFLDLVHNNFVHTDPSINE